MDHAGEYGAIRIYQAQRLLAKWRASDLLPFLDHTLEDERRHRVTFERLMWERRIMPCRTLAFWGVGGMILGLVTGALGRAAVLICTEAVERTVHRHLEDQIRWLASRDPLIAEAITAIQVEELEHLQFAAARSEGPGQSGLDKLIVGAMEALIWLSTYGASSRMAKQLAAE